MADIWANRSHTGWMRLTPSAVKFGPECRFTGRIVFHWGSNGLLNLCRKAVAVRAKAPIRAVIHCGRVRFQRVLRRKRRGAPVCHNDKPCPPPCHLLVTQLARGRRFRRDFPKVAFKRAPWCGGRGDAQGRHYEAGPWAEHS